MASHESGVRVSQELPQPTTESRSSSTLEGSLLGVGGPRCQYTGVVDKQVRGICVPPFEVLDLEGHEEDASCHVFNQAPPSKPVAKIYENILTVTISSSGVDLHKR